MQVSSDQGSDLGEGVELGQGLTLAALGPYFNSLKRK